MLVTNTVYFKFLSGERLSARKSRCLLILLPERLQLFKSKVNNEGLPGVLGNKGTLAKYRREQGNISQFLGTREQN